MSKDSNSERFLQGYRGLRGPAWRLELARDLPANRLHRLVREADPDVRDLHHYRQLQVRGDSGRARAKAIYPLIAAACALSLDKEKAAAAMILTVGGCQRNEIAARLAVDEAVLQKWEGLFFDVRESLEAVSWIHIHVIEPQRAAGNEQLVAKLKAAAAGGPVMARAILDLETRVPVTGGEKLFDRKLALHLKFDAAAEMPVETDRQKMFFIKLSADLQLKENRLKLAEKKLAQQCDEARDKQELAKIRLELAQQREANRLAVRTRRAHQRQLAVAEACQARADLESLRRAQLEAEREAAAGRAAACPLSALTWAVKTAPKATPLEMEAPVVRGGAAPRSEIMTGEVEEVEVVVPTVEGEPWEEELSLYQHTDELMEVAVSA